MTPEAQAHPTEYTVSCLPLDHPDADSFTLYVRWTGGDRWKVTTMFKDALAADGEWDGEPLPSERTDEWLAAHRFDFDTALALAKEHAPRMTLRARGRVLTVDEILAQGQRP